MKAEPELKPMIARYAATDPGVLHWQQAIARCIQLNEWERKNKARAMRIRIEKLEAAGHHDIVEATKNRRKNRMPFAKLVALQHELRKRMRYVEKVARARVKFERQKYEN